MIQQTHLTDFPKVEKGTGVVKTPPNLHLDPQRLVQTLGAQKIEDKLIGYYESKGINFPDLERMTKIEKLTLLGQERKRIKDAKAELDNIVKTKKTKTDGKSGETDTKTTTEPNGK